MMRKLLLLLPAAIILSAISSFAEDKYARYEVFGGYSLVRVRPTPTGTQTGPQGPPDCYILQQCPTFNTNSYSGENENINGWSVAFTGNINSILGIKVEVDGSAHRWDGFYGQKVKGQSYFLMAGPQINGRFEAFPGTLFGHALFGFNHNIAGEEGSKNFSKNHPELVLGGGIDWAKGPFGIRAPQIDYYTDDGGSPEYKYRISAGLVFRYGR